METVILEIVCPCCGAVHYVEVLESEFEAYENGETVLKAFRGLTATEREQIISHLCPDCQEDIFGE